MKKTDIVTQNIRNAINIQTVGKIINKPRYTLFKLSEFEVYILVEYNFIIIVL